MKVSNTELKKKTVGAEVIYVDRHGKANRCFSKLCEQTQNISDSLTQYNKVDGKTD
jgi:hypothetical protein